MSVGIVVIKRNVIRVAFDLMVNSLSLVKYWGMANKNSRKTKSPLKIGQK